MHSILRLWQTGSPMIATPALAGPPLWISILERRSGGIIRAWHMAGDPQSVVEEEVPGEGSTWNHPQLLDQGLESEGLANSQRLLPLNRTAQRLAP